MVVEHSSLAWVLAVVVRMKDNIAAAVVECIEAEACTELVVGIDIEVEVEVDSIAVVAVAGSDIVAVVVDSIVLAGVLAADDRVGMRDMVDTLDHDTAGDLLWSTPPRWTSDDWSRFSIGSDRRTSRASVSAHCLANVNVNATSSGDGRCCCDDCAGRLSLAAVAAVAVAVRRRRAVMTADRLRWRCWAATWSAHAPWSSGESWRATTTGCCCCAAET